MERVRGFIIPVLIVATLALTAVAEKENKTEGIIGGLGDELTPRPVCVSQMALANYACSMIPYSPLPPPAPPTAEEGDSSHHNRHRRHGHRHRHHSGPLSQEEEDCCRWLYEIDTDCVCEMLVRLPDFLSRPVHRYTLVVGDSCNVTYTLAAVTDYSRRTFISGYLSGDVCFPGVPPAFPSFVTESYLRCTPSALSRFFR